MTATTEWVEATPAIDVSATKHDTPGRQIHPPETVLPLMALLAELHGPTGCIGTTMNRIAPFPQQVASLPDAEVLDLAFSISAPATDRESFDISARARYATSVSIAEAFAFYCDQFQCAGVVVDTMVTPNDGGVVNFDVTLTGGLACGYHVTIHDLGSHRSVVVQATYQPHDGAEALQRWGDWHGGSAPAATSHPQGVELITVAGGAHQAPLAVLTSHYDLPVGANALRTQVDHALHSTGWTGTETVPGVLFLEGPFDAEVHVVGHSAGSSLSFVGEFTL